MKKFGCIGPSVFQLPWDLPALLPDGVIANVSTLNVRNGRPGEHERALSVLRGATDVLIDEGSEAIVVMGVPVAARRGYDDDRQALAALTADRDSVPIVSSLSAAVQALQHIGAKHPLLITQYNDEVNGQIIAYCRAAGMTPVGAVGLGATNAAMVNALSASDYDALARKALDQYPTADGIFFSARGNLFSLSQALDKSLGLPVIEQIQASVWWALSRLGVVPVPGQGRLSTLSRQ